MVYLALYFNPNYILWTLYYCIITINSIRIKSLLYIIKIYSAISISNMDKYCYLSGNKSLFKLSRYSKTMHFNILRPQQQKKNSLFIEINCVYKFYKTNDGKNGKLSCKLLAIKKLSPTVARPHLKRHNFFIAPNSHIYLYYMLMANTCYPHSTPHPLTRYGSIFLSTNDRHKTA